MKYCHIPAHRYVLCPLWGTDELMDEPRVPFYSSYNISIPFFNYPLTKPQTPQSEARPSRPINTSLVQVSR